MIERRVLLRYAEIAGLVLLSGLLSRVAGLNLLFPIPLFIIGYRFDGKEASIGAGLVFVLIFLLVFMGLQRIEEAALRHFLILLELFIPLVLAASVAVTFLLRGRQLHKLLLIAAAVVAVGYPLILYYSGVETVVVFLREQLSALLEGFRSVAAQGGSLEASVLYDELDPVKVIPLMYKIFHRYSVFFLFVVVSLDWTVSAIITKRFRLHGFKVKEEFIWLFLLAWSGVLLDVLFGLGKAAFLVWNTALILSVVYGIQGLSILSDWSTKKEIPKRTLRWMAFLLIMIVLTPGVNFVVLLGLPGIGVAELWIKMRDF